MSIDVVYYSLGAQRCVYIRQALTHLRKWFLEERSRGADITLENEATTTWERCDVTVARWLARQLGYKAMLEALEGLKDLHLDTTTSVWTLSTGEEESSLLTSVAAKEEPASVKSSSLLPRLDEISKEQIVSHIRRQELGNC